VSIPSYLTVEFSCGIREFTEFHYFYFDRCLPMGASSSCQIFEKFSCAIQWIMQTKYHAAGMSHIIDDFLFVGWN
jgi:hypothetical protein